MVPYDRWIRHQALDVFVRKVGDEVRIEAFECAFEIGPLVLNYAPHETRLKDALRHFCQPAIVRYSREHRFGFGFVDRRFKSFHTALARRSTVI